MAAPPSPFRRRRRPRRRADPASSSPRRDLGCAFRFGFRTSDRYRAAGGTGLRPLARPPKSLPSASDRPRRLRHGHLRRGRHPFDPLDGPTGRAVQADSPFARGCDENPPTRARDQRRVKDGRCRLASFRGEDLHRSQAVADVPVESRASIRVGAGPKVCRPTRLDGSGTCPGRLTAFGRAEAPHPAPRPLVKSQGSSGISTAPP